MFSLYANNCRRKQCRGIWRTLKDAPHDGTGKRTMAILTTNQLVPAVLVDRIHDAVSASRAMAITIPN